MVLLEQIQTVNKDDLTEYIGFVEPTFAAGKPDGDGGEETGTGR